MVLDVALNSCASLELTELLEVLIYEITTINEMINYYYCQIINTMQSIITLSHTVYFLFWAMM